jgi:hypothetical protein
MFRRLCITVVAGIIAMTAIAQGAVADPRKGAHFTDTCDNGQTVELVFAGGGNFTPAHVVGDTTTFVVQSITATRVFTSPAGEITTQPFVVAKPNIHGDLITCTFDVTRALPDGTTLHAFGTLVVFAAPSV